MTKTRCLLPASRSAPQHLGEILRCHALALGVEQDHLRAGGHARGEALGFVLHAPGRFACFRDRNFLDRDLGDA